MAKGNIANMNMAAMRSAVEASIDQLRYAPSSMPDIAACSLINSEAMRGILREAPADFARFALQAIAALPNDKRVIPTNTFIASGMMGYLIKEWPMIGLNFILNAISLVPLEQREGITDRFRKTEAYRCLKGQVSALGIADAFINAVAATNPNQHLGFFRDALIDDPQKATFDVYVADTQIMRQPEWMTWIVGGNFVGTPHQLHTHWVAAGGMADQRAHLSWLLLDLARNLPTSAASQSCRAAFEVIGQGRNKSITRGETIALQEMALHA